MRNFTFKRLSNFLTIFIAVTLFFNITAQASCTESTPRSITYDYQNNQILYGIDQNNNQNNVFDTSNIVASENFSVKHLQTRTTGIIGQDTRVTVSDTTASPFMTVCFIQVTYPDGTTGTASGTLVYSNVVLTAGHVIYESQHGGWATQIKVIPARNNTYEPFGYAMANQATTNEEWITNANSNFDWAILDLDSSFNTWQSYGYYYDYMEQVGKTVQCIGYPSNYMQYSTNIILGASDTQLRHACDLSVGESGGPIIDLETGLLVGINSHVVSNSSTGETVYNVAVRMNEDLFNRINNHCSNK